MPRRWQQKLQETTRRVDSRAKGISASLGSSEDSRVEGGGLKGVGGGTDAATRRWADREDREKGIGGNT